jgi:MFS family permease
VIISSGYIAAIVLNIVIGMLADRFDKLVVLGGLVAILAVAWHRCRSTTRCRSASPRRP